MTTDMQPKRLSPIHDLHQELNAQFTLQADWQIPEAYTTFAEETAVLKESVDLIDISARGKVMLKGTKADGIIIAVFGTMPTNLGDVIEVKPSNLLVAKLAPDEFLILTHPGAEQNVATSFRAEIKSQRSFVTLVDLTSGLVGLLISGPKSTEVMRKLCALDFNPINIPNLHVAQSSFAKVRTTIIRHDQNSLPTFELYADRSYAIYLWDSILDAGMEFDIQPVGWKTIIDTNIYNAQ